MSTDPVVEVLEAAHLSYRIKGTEAWASCPFHAEKTPSWSINLTNGVHSCFGCGAKGNLQSLAIHLKVPCPAMSGGYKSGKLRGEAPNKKEPNPESLLAAFLSRSSPPHTKALEARQLTEQATAWYEVRILLDGVGWIYPIRDAYTDVFLGWQEKAKGYAHIYPYGIPKHQALFGAQAVRRLVQDDLVVVESPLDACRLGGLGYSAVALYGARVSQEQMAAILRLAPGRIVVLLDLDPAGRLGVVKFREMLQTSNRRPIQRLSLPTIQPTHGTDPGDWSDEEIRRVMESCS